MYIDKDGINNQFKTNIGKAIEIFNKIFESLSQNERISMGNAQSELSYIAEAGEIVRYIGVAIENDLRLVNKMEGASVEQIERALHERTQRKQRIEEKGFFEEVYDGVCDFFDDAGETIEEGFEWLGNTVIDPTVEGIKAAWDYVATGEFIDDTNAFISDACEYIKTDLWDDVKDLIKKTAANNTNAFIALMEGVCKFCEGFVDVLIVAFTTVGTIFTASADGIIKLTTGEDADITEEMWDATMAFVSLDYIGATYDDFYENTKNGQWLDEKAGDIFKRDGIAYEIFKGIGYFIPSAIVTYFCPPLGAAIDGIGMAGNEIEETWAETRDSSWEGLEEQYKKGEISKEQWESMNVIKNLTAEEWEMVIQDYEAGIITKEQFELMKQIREMPEEWTTGENIFKGVFKGVAIGIWEGVQFYLGSYLGQNQIFSSKLASSAFNVAVDTGFGSLDTGFRTLVDMTVEEETWQAIENEDWEELSNQWDENFENNGGWESVIADTTISFIGSSAGEVFDVIKTAGGEANVIQENVDDTIKQYNTSKPENFRITDYNDMIKKHNELKVQMDKQGVQYDEAVENARMLVEQMEPQKAQYDKALSDAADSLMQNSNIMNDKYQYREYQIKLFKELSRTMGDEEAAMTASGIFQKVVEKRRI